MTDTSTMTDDQLNEMIANNPSEHDTSNDGIGNDTTVSPLDDTEEQVEDNESQPDVDQADEESEDLEGGSSTDEDDDQEEESEEAENNDELDDSTSEDESEDTSEPDEEHQKFQPLRADGKEYPIESLDELYHMAAKSIGADNRFRESAAGRKIQKTMEKNGLSEDDINMLVELKSGNKEAIMSLLKKADIDPLDIDADAFNDDYKPKDHTTGDFELALDDVVTRIKTKPRYEESVSVIMDKWDEGSKNAFYENPKILELLNIDMQTDENGFSMYDKVIPVMEKMKVLDGGSGKTDLEFYIEAGAKVIDALKRSEEATRTKQEKEKEKNSNKQAEIKKKKKAAAPSGGRSSGGTQKKVEDMTDEELDALLEKTN